MQVIKQLIENEYVRLTTVIAVIVAAVGFARYDIQSRDEVKHSIRELSTEVNFKIDKIETKIDLAAREHWTKADMLRWSTKTERQNETWKSAEVE